jgi:hypothetical protein
VPSVTGQTCPRIPGRAPAISKQRPKLIAWTRCLRPTLERSRNTTSHAADAPQPWRRPLPSFAQCAVRPQSCPRRRKPPGAGLLVQSCPNAFGDHPRLFIDRKPNLALESCAPVISNRTPPRTGSPTPNTSPFRKSREPHRMRLFTNSRAEPKRL